MSNACASVADTLPDVREETETGRGQYAHIVHNGKDAVAWAYIEQAPVEALCGYRWVPSKDPKSKPVCPECKAVYDDDEAIILAARSAREESI